MQSRFAKVTLAATLVLLAAGCGALRFTLTFKDARNLQIGDPLVYRGLKIGEVKSISAEGTTIKVVVQVVRQYRNTVYREATYVIEAPDGLLDRSGRRQVTMKDPMMGAKARSAVQEADIIAGSDGLAGTAETLSGVAGKIIQKVLTH